MKGILYYKDLYEVCKGNKLGTISKKERKTQNRKATTTIHQWVDDMEFHHMSKESMTQLLWKKLDNYIKRGIANKFVLSRKLVNSK